MRRFRLTSAETHQQGVAGGERRPRAAMSTIRGVGVSSYIVLCNWCVDGDMRCFKKSFPVRLGILWCSCRLLKRVCLPSNAHGWLASTGRYVVPTKPPSSLRHARTPRLSNCHSIVCSAIHLSLLFIPVFFHLLVEEGVSTDNSGRCPRRPQNNTSRVGPEFGVP